jgi:protein TonB
MDFSQVDKNPTKKFTGLILVVLLHVFIVYALVSGLARNVVEIIKAPIETKLIEEIKPPPPPPDTPPPPPPKMAAPPPPFIPPPEVSVQQPVVPNVISVASTVAPATTTLAPIQPAAQPAAAASTGPVKVAAVVDSRACTKPEYPAKSLRNEETGVVTLQFLIGIDGKVVESKVEKSSGFRDLDIAARNALSLCKFKPGTTDGKPEQSWTKMQYVWKLE